MIGIPRAGLEQRVEAMIPSLFPKMEWSSEGRPYVYPYTCREHDVTGNSQTPYPRLCWFGGERVDPTPQAQSQVRGAPRR